MEQRPDALLAYAQTSFAGLIAYRWIHTKRLHLQMCAHLLELHNCFQVRI